MAMSVRNHPISTPKRDLWAEAYNALPADLQAALKSSQPRKRKLDILQEIIDAAEAKQAKYRRRPTILRHPPGEGEDIFLRHVYEMIIKWVDIFKATGDTAVQYDPDHAALPWVALRFILQASVGQHEFSPVLVCHFETVSRMIARYGHFERRHPKSSQGGISSELQGVLLRLYTSILRFLASAVASLRENTLRALARGPRRHVDDGELKPIAAAEDEILKLVDGADTERLRAIEDRTVRRVDIAELYPQQLEDDAEYADLLGWISDVEYAEHHRSHSALRRRTVDTGDWLFKEDAYQQWMQSNSSEVLLVQGITGSGKTMLVSRVIDTIKANIASSNATMAAQDRLAYFYCSKHPAEPKRANVDEIWRSIVRQLAVDEASKRVEANLYREYERRKEQAAADDSFKTQLTAEESVRLVVQMLRAEPATVIFDAVDELSAETCDQLLSRISSIAQQSDNVVKILVTSRGDDTMLFNLEVSRSIQITPKVVKPDIEAFAAHAVQAKQLEKRWQTMAAASDSRPALASLLASQAGEMYVLPLDCCSLQNTRLPGCGVPGGAPQTPGLASLD